MKRRHTMSLLTTICMAATCMLAAGCGTVSVATLHGVYIEGDTGKSLTLSLDRSGASVYMNGTYDKTKNMIYGDCLTQNAKFTLVGDTVRVEGGEPTAYGQALNAFSPSRDNGNVMLFTLADSGQSLSYTNHNGRVLKFIKQ